MTSAKYPASKVNACQMRANAKEIGQGLIHIYIRGQRGYGYTLMSSRWWSLTYDIMITDHGQGAHLKF